MALTFRTGSGGKGSALTIEELDNNFRFFTGSHPVSGSFVVTGSMEVIGDTRMTGSLTVSGSNTFENVGPFLHSGGDFHVKVSEPVGEAKFSGSVRITDVGNPTSGSFQITGSTAMTGSRRQNILDVRGTQMITGSLTMTSSAAIPAELKITGSLNLHSQAADSLVVSLVNLPTSDPGVAGRLYNDSGTIKISL
tara:strand:+ start:103 stop:684 length:582 start_codon:yes stop_codon:yes gene_type:complete